MRLRCPCCGASMSLDALIAHDDARAALTALAALGDDLTRITLKYLGLFRPEKSELSFARVGKLVDDLLPDIRRGSIRRHGSEHPAPRAAWLWALQEVIGARARLELPLRNHAYLYQVLTAWRPEAPRPAPGSGTTMVSRTDAGIAALEGLL